MPEQRTPSRMVLREINFNLQVDSLTGEDTLEVIYTVSTGITSINVRIVGHAQEAAALSAKAQLKAARLMADLLNANSEEIPK